jgi:NAD(P)H-hydrate epimerase
MKVVRAEEMRQIDLRAQDEFGISPDELMAQAGLSVAREILNRFEPARVCIVCGKGNNAGDGFVVARELAAASVDVHVVCVTPPAQLRGTAANAYALMAAAQVPTSDADTLAARLRACEVVVDAVLGTGVRGQVTGPLAAAIRSINRVRKPVVAIDVPSGLRELEPGEKPGDIVNADLTVTIGLPKISLLTLPGWEYAGEVIVAPINFPRPLLKDPALPLNMATVPELRAWLPSRPALSNKGTYGRAGIIAGSAPYAGAAILAARGALRCGCGLAQIFTPHALNPIFKSALPEAITSIVPAESGEWLDASSADAITRDASSFKALAVGPGIGTTLAQADLVRHVIGRTRCPIILDADALTCLALQGGLELLRERRKCVLTPHPGEMARLIGRTVRDVQADRVGIAQQFAVEHAVTVLLKGAGSVVAAPDGQVHVVPGGTSALAKGGTGDVLTGMIAGFAAQGLDPLNATILSAHLHLQAGMICAEKLGERSVLASEVADAIPEALLLLEAGEGEG